MNLLFLLFLHHLADVAFQPSWLIKSKKLHAFSIYEHAFVWAGTVSMGLYLLGMFSIPKFLFLLSVHWAIDFFKYKGKSYNLTYIDQLAHYIQVIIVYII
jgi:hypothetical protein